MSRSRRKLRVLLVEDCEEVAVLLRRHLESCGYFLRGRQVHTLGEMSTALRQQAWDVVLADHEMPHFDAIGALELLQRLRPDIPLILVSGTVSDDFAADLMRRGARDFVSKNNLARLHPAIEREVSGARRSRRTTNLETELGVVNRQLEQALHTLAKTQDHLVRSERIKALGQMASGVAHDFNNSLTRMIGIIELMSERSAEQDPALQQLQTTVLQAANIVRRLRGFYRPVNAVDDMESLDLNDVLRKSVELTKPKWKAQSSAEGHPIAIAMNLTPVPAVAGRLGDLQEAFAHLIFNACEAMPGGGIISIATSADAGEVVATIRDNGAGMTEETRQRCLEPYFTAKGQTRSGMGLALVDALIRSYGGKLDVKSTLGAGTTLRLRLPELKNCESTDSPGVQEAPPLIAPLRILLADDDLAVSILISQFLRLDGHEVEIVKDGQKALEHFDPARHQLVISDRAMPVIDGEILAAAIKTRAPATPVIMASGFVDGITGDGEKPPGVDYLLRKPITREDLRRAVASVSPGA